MAHCIQRLRAGALRLAARFAGDTRGSVAILYVTSALAIIGFVALAVDGARAHILRSQLHYAVDAAAIAIGKDMKSLNEAKLLALADKYIRANVSPSMLGLAGGFGPGDLTIAVLPGDTDDQKKISATARLHTTLLGLVDGAATVDIQRSSVVQRAITGLELALAVDVTGSMDWDSGTPGMTRIEALKAAATDLLDIVFGANATHPKAWISVAPFTRSVQAQPHVDWVQSGTMTPVLPSSTSSKVYSWDPEPDLAGGDSFCLGPRATEALAESDAPPSDEATKFPAAYEYDTTYLGYSGAKKRYSVSVDNGDLCPAVEHTLLPLTNVRADVQSHIDALVPNGRTATDRGAVWGWRTLSAKWRGYWNVSDPARPLNTDDQTSAKVLVLMTDGENTDTSTSDPALTRICANAKADGVTIMTIAFAMPESLYPLYRDCASSADLFFPAADGDQLRSAFEAIALQLSVLRLVQ